MSVNISKKKREEVIGYVDEISDIVTMNNPEFYPKLKQIAIELQKKQYGITFEEYEERIDKIIKDNIPVVIEDTNKRIVNDDKYNFLIEGDNLAALKLLEKTHLSRINCIYIDPPYNRGKNDFIYDDDFIGDNDTFKHSKWLSFMEKRLRSAKKLLSYDGVIFISIDDKEVNVLKLLCDDIFGVDCFITCMPRLTKKNGKSTNNFSKNHDYILVYVRENNNVFIAEEHIDSGFKYSDEFIDERGLYKLNQTLDYNTLGYVNSLDFPIEIDNKVYYPGSVTEKEYLARKKDNPKDGYRWRWSKELVEFGLENGWIEVNKNTGRIYTKTYLKANISKSKKGYDIVYKDRTKPISSVDFIANDYSNDKAKKELDSFGIEDKFDYPKPSSLIKRLVNSYYAKDAIILDFFAGSGTTGQAVLDLNKEDGGTRSFILCTNNQNGICENITYPRLKKVINGFSFKEDITEVIYEKKITIKSLENSIIDKKVLDVLNNAKEKYDSIKKEIIDNKLIISGTRKKDVTKDSVGASLKYFKISFVNIKDRTYEDYSDELLEYCKGLVELQYGVSFDTNDRIKIILDDASFDEFFSRIGKNNINKVFIGNNVLVDTEQKHEILNNNIDLFILPDYYYEF